VVPKGTSLIGSTLQFTQSHTQLRIEDGATLLVSDDMEKWPDNQHIIYAESVTDIAITGSGTVDGQGLIWWRERHHSGWRPHTVGFKHVTRALLQDTLYMNGPSHILELGCDYCELDGIKVLNPPSTGDCEKDNSCSHNTDAVDVHGEPFWVHDVNFTTGDDNIAGHANNTVVEDSYFGTGHGASIGSLCNDWITGVSFRNITFEGTTAGGRIKLHPKCGGHVWNVTYEDLRMHNVEQPIDLTMFYFAEKNPPSSLGSTARFTDIRYKDITMKSCGKDGKGEHAITFDCDTLYDKTDGNCVVEMDNVQYDNDGGNDVEMECQGTYGSANGIKGIKSCLGPSPSPSSRRRRRKLKLRGEVQEPT